MMDKTVNANNGGEKPGQNPSSTHQEGRRSIDLILLLSMLSGGG
jgi:hypothetical protein